MTEDHTRKATHPSIDLPPPLASPAQRLPSPVLQSPLPSTLSTRSVDSDSASPPLSDPVVPPAPARKRRAAAVAAESAIRQQLSDASDTRRGALHSGSPDLELICDEDESTIDSCLSMTSAMSTVSQPDTTAYLTPEPRKRRSRRRRNKAEPATASAVDTSTSPAGALDQSSMVIPTYLPPPIHPPANGVATPPMRRSARQLPKAHSLVHSSPTAAPAVLSRMRATSLPALHRPAHAIFHDGAIIASLLSGLSLASFLRLRAVSSAFLRASYTTAAWQYQHVLISDEAALLRLRSTTALFALLPSLTVNLISCPTLGVDQTLRAVLARLPSVRRLRLLNCMKLTQLGVNAVLYCGALTELTIQNCGSLQSNSLHDLLQPLPSTHSYNHTHTSLIQPPTRDPRTDAYNPHSTLSDPLAAHRSAAYVAALVTVWAADRPLYDPARLVLLDLTKYRNLRDESFVEFSHSHFALSFVALRSLNLRGCREVSDASMGRIANISLQSLDLSFCVQVTDKGIERLADPARRLCQTLTSLTLTSITLLTDGACESIAAFTSLSHLVLSQLPRLTDHGLIALQRGPACLSLRQLVVSWCDRLVGDWLVSAGEGWTRHENDRRMGADFLDYLDAQHGASASDAADDDDAYGPSRDCDSDGDGIELADARREATVIGRRRTAQRDRRRRLRDAGRAGVGLVGASEGDEREMWSALRYVDVRYCHGIDVGSKVILARLRPDIELVWR